MQGLDQLPRRRQAVTILRRASGSAPSTSAVTPGALSAEWRFALVATHPTGVYTLHMAPAPPNHNGAVIEVLYRNRETIITVPERGKGTGHGE